MHGIDVLFISRCAADERQKQPLWYVTAKMSAHSAFSAVVQLAILLFAAVFEVAGDALIRAGLRGKVIWLVVLGFSALGSYGLVLNQIPLDFSKLLGVYVALFALVSVLFGKFLFHELIASSTWLGLCVVLLGSAIIQWG